MAIIRVCYKPGRFDEDYYLSKHLPLSASVFGPHGLTNVEVMRVASTPDGSPPQYQVIFSAHFDSAAGIQASMNDPRFAEVMADIPNYYDGAQPDLFIGEILETPLSSAQAAL
jgi:uncharacterized protein (TIGR02118 family)